jgi:very-short-patch-repair endonuclease
VTATRLALGRPHPDSPGELALHAAQQRGRLAGFVPNVVVEGYVVDLLHAGARVVVEVDGLRWHDADPERAEADRRRDRHLTERGYRVLRYTSREAVEETARVVAEAEQAAETALRRCHAAWDLADRASRAELELQRARSTRTKVHRLVQRIARWHDVTHGHGTGEQVARRLNRELAARFGPAAARTEEQHRAALDVVDEQWTRFRAEHGVRESDVPEHDAVVRPAGCCAQAEQVTCTVCEETTDEVCDEHRELRGWLTLSEDGPVCRDCWECGTSARTPRTPTCFACGDDPHFFDVLWNRWTYAGLDEVGDDTWLCEGCLDRWERQ